MWSGTFGLFIETTTLTSRQYTNMYCIYEVYSVCIKINIYLAFLMKVDHFDLVILKVARKPKKCGTPGQGVSQGYTRPRHMLSTAGVSQGYTRPRHMLSTGCQLGLYTAQAYAIHWVSVRAVHGHMLSTGCQSGLYTGTGICYPLGVNQGCTRAYAIHWVSVRAVHGHGDLLSTAGVKFVKDADGSLEVIALTLECAMILEFCSLAPSPGGIRGKILYIYIYILCAHVYICI